MAKLLTHITGTQNVMETEQKVNKKKSVAYIFNDEYLKLCSQLPKVENRVSLNCLTLRAPELHFCTNQYTCKRPQSYIFKYPAPLHKTRVAYSYN